MEGIHLALMVLIEFREKTKLVFTDCEKRKEDDLKLSLLGQLESFMIKIKIK